MASSDGVFFSVATLSQSLGRPKASSTSAIKHPEYQTFDRLNPFRIHWNIKARVCRIWHHFEVQRSSHQKTILKVLLIDEKSDQMLLTLQANEIKSFGTNLKEGTTIYIKQVKVVDASKTYRIVLGTHREIISF